MQVPEWIDERYVVVFVEDGSVLETCKSFKFNVQEIMHKYELKKPKDPRIPIPKEDIQVNAKFQKRAYKELLEFCGDHMKEHELKESVKYKTLYTLEGTQLETMEDLKNFCLLEGFSKGKAPKRGPTLKLNASSRDASSDEDMTEVKRLNKASFVISPTSKAQRLETDRLIPEESASDLSSNDGQHDYLSAGASLRTVNR